MGENVLAINEDANSAGGLRALARRVLRFGISGILSTLIYFAIALVLVATTSMPVFGASFLAFCGAGAISYLLHRCFTFENRDRSRETLARFIAVNLVANAIAIATPWAISDYAGYPAIVGIALVCVLVPAFNFVLLSVYVFRRADAVREGA